MSYQIAELLDGVSVGENRNRSNQNFQNLLALINEHGFVWNGDYVDAAEYVKGDVVKYNHSLYIAKVPTTGLLPTNVSAWDLLVESYQGDTGPVGPQGTGITSIVRTSGTGAPGTSDTYTITFSNATTTTFQVWNGSNGTGNMNTADNLSGLANIATARSNLGVYSTTEVDAADALKANLSGGNTFSGNQVISGSASLSVSSGGGSTPNAINIGSGGTLLGQDNGNTILKSGFSGKTFNLADTAGAAQYTVALDTGISTQNGSSTIGNGNTSSGQQLSVNGNDHVYFAWLVNLVRKAYVGFGGVGLTTFTLSNEQTNGDINFVTNGTGAVKINGTTIPLTGGVDILSVRSFF